MRRIGRALFVIFYFAATIGVASERCAYMADRVGHSASSEFEGVKSPFASFVKYLPYFSHAKKGKTAVAEVPPESSWAPETIVWKYETSPTIEFAPAPSVETHSSRGPPALI